VRHGLALFFPDEERITPAAQMPGMSVSRKNAAVIVVQRSEQNKSVAGPTIAPTVSIIRSKPKARP